MARSPRRQQKTDARRIAARGTGKLDRPAAPAAGARATRRRATGERERSRASAPARERLLREREAAIEQLKALGLAPDHDLEGPRGGGGESVLDIGDVAQVSEGQDMSAARRARLATRINRLTAALERLARGTYGVCEICGQPIDAARLEALPEATNCRACQEDLERRPRTAA
jgi:DnaK suppressor protein